MSWLYLCFFLFVLSMRFVTFHYLKITSIHPLARSWRGCYCKSCVSLSRHLKIISQCPRLLRSSQRIFLVIVGIFAFVIAPPLISQLKQEKKYYWVLAYLLRRSQIPLWFRSCGSFLLALHVLSWALAHVWGAILLFPRPCPISEAWLVWPPWRSISIAGKGCYIFRASITTLAVWYVFPLTANSLYGTNADHLTKAGAQVRISENQSNVSHPFFLWSLQHCKCYIDTSISEWDAAYLV